MIGLFRGGVDRDRNRVDVGTAELSTIFISKRVFDSYLFNTPTSGFPKSKNVVSYRVRGLIR